MQEREVSTINQQLENEIMERFGYMGSKLLREEISDLIQKRGWQQKEFAELCNLSNATISRTLSGDMTISKEIAEIYAEVLGLDREEIVRRAFVECTCTDFLKRYQEYQLVCRLGHVYHRSIREFVLVLLHVG